MNIIDNYLRNTNKTKYRLSKESGIPYSTVSDICSGRTPLNKCSAETIYRLSRATGMPCNDIIASACEQKVPFELFKSNVCHEVKQKGEIRFLIDTIESDAIRGYFVRMRYEESLYLLAMTDYLSRKNEVPLCTDYDDLRHCRFKEPIYPDSLSVRARAMKDASILEEARDNAIPEFTRHNIIENEVEDVC